MNPYTPDLMTLDAFKQIQGIDDNNDDARITSCIHEASAWFGNHCDRAFVPYDDTQTFDARGDHVTPTRLTLDTDLLAVGTLTNGDATTLAASAYRLRPTNQTPAFEIELLPSSGKTFTYTTDWQNALSVQGTWGYHENYARAWKRVTTSAGTLSASDTALVPSGGTAGLEVLAYLRMGSEQLQVTASSTGTLTVLRGVHGTSAAAHGTLTGVDVYQQTPDVQMAVKQITQFLYEHRDTSGNQVQVAGSAVIFEGRFPPEVWGAVNRYRRKELWAG